MTLDLTQPLMLNDGTPVELHRVHKHKLAIRVPEGHRLDMAGYNQVRDFAPDGTRYGIGADGPLGYYLVNVEPTPDLPTEKEWERLIFDSPKQTLIDELRRRNLIKPTPDPVLMLAREIASMDPDDIDAIADKIRAFSP